jgi:hypothetical protein
MLRTIAILLLLLGLATATPVVCLCAPSEGAGWMAGVQHPDGYGVTPQRPRNAASDPDSRGPSLLATSAAAVVASLIATAAGLPSSAPWRFPLPLAERWRPGPLRIPSGLALTPTVPPPR